MNKTQRATAANLVLGLLSVAQLKDGEPLRPTEKSRWLEVLTSAPEQYLTLPEDHPGRHISRVRAYVLERLHGHRA